MGAKEATQGMFLKEHLFRAVHLRRPPRCHFAMRAIGACNTSTLWLFLQLNFSKEMKLVNSGYSGRRQRSF